MRLGDRGAWEPPGPVPTGQTSLINGHTPPRRARRGRAPALGQHGPGDKTICRPGARARARLRTGRSCRSASRAGRPAPRAPGPGAGAPPAAGTTAATAPVSRPRLRPDSAPAVCKGLGSGSRPTGQLLKQGARCPVPGARLRPRPVCCLEPQEPRSGGWGQTEAQHRRGGSGGAAWPLVKGPGAGSTAPQGARLPRSRRPGRGSKTSHSACQRL